jgi:voltage-gated potassium channel
VFTIGVILSGFLVLAVSAQIIMSIVLEKIVSRTMGHNKMEKEIATLEGHYIVCGFGRVGEAAVSRLSRENIDFVVIEMDEMNAEKLLQAGYFTIWGNGTDEEILLKAGIKKARGLLVLTSSETENLYITLTARELNPTLQIIARGENQSSERKLKRAGADEVISPYTFAGVQIAEKVLLATDQTSFGFSEKKSAPEWISVSPESDWVGQKLGLVAAKEGWHVLGVRRGRKDSLSPKGDRRIKKGDQLLIFRKEKQYPRNSNTRSVLIVEDNRVTANLYTRLLRRENFNAKYVTDGMKALEVISAEKPDVAVVDHMLPGMSGIEVCRAVRSNPELNKVRLILFTGDEHPGTKRRALASGVDAFLLKTSEASELVEKIRKVLAMEPETPSFPSETENEKAPLEVSPPALENRDDRLKAESKPPIHFSEAFDRCGNDWDFFSEMFTEFVHYLPEQSQKIRDAYEKRDWEMLHSEGHRFKGAAANFGATVLTDLARRIEEAGRNREDVEIADVIRKMEARAEILRQFRDSMKPELVARLAK